MKNNIKHVRDAKGKVWVANNAEEYDIIKAKMKVFNYHRHSYRTNKEGVIEEDWITNYQYKKIAGIV